MGLCTTQRHVWSWGANRATDTPPPHVRCTCGRIRWQDYDELQAERARANTAEAALADERRYRDVAELEAAEYRAALELSAVQLVRSIDNVLMTECRVCRQFWDATDPARHSERCLLTADTPARGAALMAALQWYAAEDTWTCLEGNHAAHCGPGDCAPAIDADGGERARRALAGRGEEPAE